MQIVAYVIMVQLVSNWEQNMLYTNSLHILFRKKISILVGMKVSSLTCKCVFYRRVHNAKRGEPHAIEF